MVFEPDFLTYKGEAFAPSLEDVRLITELRIKLPEITRVEAEFTLQSFIDATDRSRSLSRRISSFIAGEGQLSRGVGTIFDFVTIFVPFGRKIDRGRDALRLAIQRKTKRDQNMDKIKGLIKQDSTKAGIIGLAAILTWFGIEVDAIAVHEAIKNIAQGATLVVAGFVYLWEVIRNERTE